MAWTDRYVRDDAAGGGAGTADNSTDAWTLAEAAANVVPGDRVNVRNGTYSNGTSIVALGSGGLTGSPIWWRGFASTPGDLDSDNTLAKPLIDFTTGNFVVGSTFHLFSNIRFNSATVAGSTGGTVGISSAGTDLVFWRCRFTNTAANANGFAFRPAGQRVKAVGCYFSATSSAHCISIQADNTLIQGSYIDGGNTGILSANRSYLLGNMIDNPNLHGIDCTSTGSSIVNNSIYSAGTDGIRCANTTAMLVIANNIIAESGGWGINFSAGNNGAALVYGNGFRSNTSGEINGLTETWTWLNQSYGSDPFTNAAGDDFSLASAFKALGFPGPFENETFISYLDQGAVQREEPTGGGGTSVFLVEG
jgi:hypothetical protein